MRIELDDYHAITLVAFLLEFEKDFADREDCTTISKASNEFIEAVCMQTSLEEVKAISDEKLKADFLLGWVPQKTKQ